MKHGLRILGSLALSGIFLYLAARGVSWDAVWEALRDAHLFYVAPMALGAVVPLWFRALRWQVLIRPIRPVGVRSLFSATAIGFAANMLLPLRAGEVVRPWVLARREGIGFVPAMATVALERLFDMATLLLFFSVATLTLPLPAEWKRYGWFFLATFVVLLILLFALRHHPERFEKLAAALLRPAPRRLAEPLLAAVHGFAAGLASLGSGRAVAIAMAHSLGVWLSISISFGFGLSAFALDVPWVRAALTATTFTAIAVSIPGGPGFVGMFQVGCVVALGVFEVPKSVAFSYSVLTHLVQFASTLLVGLYFFAREGLRLEDIRHLENGPGAAAIEGMHADTGR